MLSDEQYEMIDRYVSGGDMTEAEKNAYEVMLRADPALMDEVRRYRQVFQEINYNQQFGEKESAVAQMSSQLNQEFFRTGKPAPRIRPLRRRFLTGLAAAATLIGVVFLVRFVNGPDTGALYHEYAQYPPLTITTRGNIAADSLLQTVEATFNNRQYARCLELLDRLPDSLMTQRLELSEGICQTETGDFQGAERRFNQLIQSGSMLQHEARFYQALSRLKQDKPAEARVLLHEIPSSAAIYERAKALLDDL